MIFGKLSAAFRANPPLFERNVSKSIQLLKSENYIYPTISVSAQIILQNNCDLTAYTGRYTEWIRVPKRKEYFVQRYSETLIQIFPFIRNKLEPRYEQYVSSTCAIEQNLSQVPRTALAISESGWSVPSGTVRQHPLLDCCCC